MIIFFPFSNREQFLKKKQSLKKKVLMKKKIIEGNLYYKVKYKY